MKYFCKCWLQEWHRHICIWEVKWHCRFCTFLFTEKLIKILMTQHRNSCPLLLPTYRLGQLFIIILIPLQSPISPPHVYPPTHTRPALVPVIMPLPLRLKTRLLQTAFAEFVTPQRRLQATGKNTNAQFPSLGQLQCDLRQLQCNYPQYCPQPTLTLVPTGCRAHLLCPCLFLNSRGLY